MRNAAIAATVSLFFASCTRLAASTPTPVPAEATTPAPSSTPVPTLTATSRPGPPPTATPQVLANGWYQLELSSLGLTLSFPPEIVRSWDVDERVGRQPYIELRLRPQGVLIVIAAPCSGYSLETIARSTDELCGLLGSFPHSPPKDMNYSLIAGDPALRVVVSDTDLRAGVVFLRHRGFVIEAAAWAGEMVGGVVYSPSERVQILTWFNQVLETFRFSP